MKKVLFLTTALIATGSMAAADIRFSGYGRFGLDYNERNSEGTEDSGADYNITSRLRLQMDASTETDGGITFGARVRFQNSNSGGNEQSNGMSGARFFVATGGLNVGFGNTWGGFDFAQGLYLPTRSVGAGIDGMGWTYIVANMGGNNFDWSDFSSAGSRDDEGVELIYNGANWGVHASYNTADDATTTDGEENVGINGYYTFGNWTVSAAYNDEKDGTDAFGDSNDLLMLAVLGDLGFARVQVAYARMKDLVTFSGPANADDAEKVQLVGAFDIGAATTLIGFVSNEDSNNSPFDGTSYGLHVTHDLGGGVSLEAAFVEEADNNSRFQAGAYFSF